MAKDYFISADHGWGFSVYLRQILDLDGGATK